MRSFLNCLSLAILLLLPVAPAAGQGFVGLGSDAEGFAIPRPGIPLQFPRDHGAHPDHRIEWWYVTANLTGDDSSEYGLQWTLFRSALAPAGADDPDASQIWFGHAAITSEAAHYAAERFARGGTGQAGVTAEPFAAWIDEWRLAGERFDDELYLTAAGPDFAYDLRMEAKGPIVLHGDAGYSVKSQQGQASHYYSQPFFAVKGMLALPGGEVAVEGEAWLDREWSSQPLAADQTGWDWFSLSLDSGEKLMGFRLRSADDDSFTSASWILQDGTVKAYGNGQLTATPAEHTRVAGRSIPTKWRLVLPERSLDILVEAMNPQSWMDLTIPYWEGPVRVSGTHSGRGYLEMTGYAP